MCKYCENGKKIELSSNYAKSYWFIIQRNGQAKLYCKIGESEYGNAYGIKIKYCPMCDGNLTEEENTAETKPIVHAHAIIYWLGDCKCSNCKSAIDITEPYCQHCGATLDEPEEREE